MMRIARSQALLCLSLISGAVAADLQTRLHDLSWADLSCLKAQPKGCAALKDQFSCLSSKIDDEAPCLWCGGGPCIAGSMNLCESLPTFKAAEEATINSANLVVPGCEDGMARVFKKGAPVILPPTQEPEMHFSDEDVGCLKPAEKGCNMIRDAVTCTNSREERPYEYIAGFKVKGQPCVWCGGGQCHDGADTLCEPYDYALYGAGHAFHTKYSHGPFYKAFCNKDDQPGAEMLPADWQIHGMRMHVDCGKPFPVWAKVGQRCGFCKVLVPSIKEDFTSCKDYCASQGNLQCASAALSSVSSCDVKEEKSCDYAFQVYEHGLCECSFESTVEAKNEDFDKALPAPKEAEMHCLKKAEKGCRAITDRLNCLSSVDDGYFETLKGVKVKGEPCVWCGGVACTSHDPAVLCEARDYLVNGKGLAFVHRHVAVENADVAKCEAPKRSFGNLGCLQRQEKGCNSIQDMDTCLSSLDGRPFDQVAGLQVEGQPCVWCGGVPCNSNNGNLCEPYDFALHGEGHAYDVNHAEDTYYTAACEAGRPVKHSHSTAMERKGITTMVDCGTPQPMWHGVGKTCGECKVQVAIEATKSFGNCDGYCKSQGLNCEKAFSSHLHSCDLKSEEPMSCQSAFDDESTGYLCHCQAPHQDTPEAQDTAQAMYGQCGGKDWKGYTQCEVGAVCNVVDEDFSQCVPAGAAKPGVRAYGPQSPVASTLAAAAPSLSLEDDLGEAPPVEVKGGSCSSHPKCAALKLAGDCCPNSDGVLLDCCSTGSPKAVVLNPVAPAVTPVVPAEANLEAVPIQAAGQSQWWKIPKPSQDQLKCMPAEPKGCGSITHKLMCLSRVDGRTGYAPHGLNVGGEPCVWCGGGPCTSYSDAVCEPYNWLVKGEGKAFASHNAAPSTWLVAKCQDDRNSVFNNLGCLRASEIGCNHITEKHQCLASMDARPFVEVAGFKARSQPCVWCGGGTCHSNNRNLCEPYDFVMNGQGQAFESNYGFNTYMVAECTQDGRVLPMSYPHADVERGLPTQVTCAGKHTWSGVGKICGDCDVTVPNIYASFGSCNAYCAAQGGLKCLSAKKAFTHSCSAQPPDEYDFSCASAFGAGEFARCHCSASEKADAVLVDANSDLPALPYAQCGGKEWTGIRRCQAGSSCFIINRWYSQCLPGAYSNPDQAAQAAKNAAEASGKPIQDQAVIAGAAATKAANAAGQSAQSQATRAYVAAAGTAAIGGVARPEAHGIGEAAAHAASNSVTTLTKQEAQEVAQKAIHDGEAIVFGEDQSSSAAEIAGTAAANGAKDTGLSGDEQCHKAYHAALKFAKGSGRTPKQQAELAASVAQKAAFRAELTPLQQVQCVVSAAQANAKADGAMSDSVADAMTHAGTAAARGAGIQEAQVNGVVAECIKATEDGKSDLQIPKEVMDKCMATAEGESLGAAAEELAMSRTLEPKEAAQAARKCIYDAAIQSGKTPGVAAAASEAASASVAEAMVSPDNEQVKPESVQRVGQDCWMACGKQSGLCAFCGVGNACCRRDETNPMKVCQNIKTFSTWHHECVRPMHLPQDMSIVAEKVHEALAYETAAEASQVAGAAVAAGGHGAVAQAEAAGAAAAQAAEDGGLNTVNQVTVAYKAAENVGKEGGMTQWDADQTAQTVAEDVAEDSGMSSTEATAVAAAAAAVVHGLPLPGGGSPSPPLQPPVLEPGPVILPAGAGTPAKPMEVHTQSPVEPTAVPPLVASATPLPLKPGEVPKPPVAVEATVTPSVVEKVTPLPLPEKVDEQILPQPIPASAQAGIAAAIVKKNEGGDVHQQAIVAAGTTGSYEVADHKTQEEAEEIAVKAAEYVAHKDGMPLPQAKAEANSAVTQAIANQGGHFVHQSVMQHKGQECFAACGSKAGYCPSFCGIGACCKKMDSPTIPECQNATLSDQYQCVAPAAVFPTGDIRKRQADSNSTYLVVDAGAETVQEGVQGVGIGLWMVVLAALLACLVCCGGWLMVCCGGKKKRKEQTRTAQTRTAGVSLSKSDGEDLELQEPLQAAAPTSDPRAIGEAPAAAMLAPGAVAYRYVSGSSQGYMAAPLHDQASSSSVRPMAPVRSLAAAPVASAGMCSPCPVATLWDQFDRIDTNHDGVLQRREWNEALQAGPIGPYRAQPHPSQDSLPRQAAAPGPRLMMEPTTQH